MLPTFDEVAHFSPQLPYAALAAGPGLRSAAERRESVTQNSDHVFTLDRLRAEQARDKEVCLFIPPEAEDVLVVTLHGFSRRGSVQAAADAGMWWVDRCLQETSTTTCAARLACCVRMEGMSVDKLYLYSSADVNGSAQATAVSGSTAGVRRLRVPNAHFALQMQRMVELRSVQLSPSVSRLIVEVDVRSCLRWSQADVNSFLTSLNSPLCAIRVPTVSLAAVTLLRRFYATLRVLHLCRRSTAIFHDPQGAMMFEDEELEEEETRTDSSPHSAPNSVETSGKIPPPPAPQPAPPVTPPRAPSPSKSKRSTSVSATKAVKGAESGTRSGKSARPRRSKHVIQLSTGATPVLEELHIASSVRRRLPDWVKQCSNLQHLTLSGCRYDNLSALRHVVGLREVKLESCSNFTRFAFFCGFPELRVLSIKNCAQLRSIAWLPRLSGALRSLTIHHNATNSLTSLEEAATVGIGLDYLQFLSLSIPAMTQLKPLVVHAAKTLHELTLFACMNVEDFASLPPLPALEKVSITGNRHMQNFEWLKASPLLTEVRAAQCLQLSSLAGLKDCRQLRVLELAGAPQLQDISDIASCTMLTYLDLSQCSLISNVSVLRSFPHLSCVLLRNCVRIPKDFGWLEACPALADLMVPNQNWYEAANEKLQQLHRSGSVLLH